MWLILLVAALAAWMGAPIILVVIATILFVIMCLLMATVNMAEQARRPECRTRYCQNMSDDD